MSEWAFQKRSNDPSAQFHEDGLQQATDAHRVDAAVERSAGVAASGGMQGER